MRDQTSLPPTVKTQIFSFRRFLSQHRAISRDITLGVPEVSSKWHITIVLDKLAYISISYRSISCNCFFPDIRQRVSHSP
jgi:hypothetical protein